METMTARTEIECGTFKHLNLLREKKYTGMVVVDMKQGEMKGGEYKLKF